MIKLTSAMIKHLSAARMTNERQEQAITVNRSDLIPDYDSINPFSYTPLTLRTHDEG